MMIILEPVLDTGYATCYENHEDGEYDAEVQYDHVVGVWLKCRIHGELRYYELSEYYGDTSTVSFEEMMKEAEEHMHSRHFA